MIEGNSLYPEDKKERYQLIINQLDAFLDGETDLIANLSNTSALLMAALPDLNWAGFYLMKRGELILGPFQGKVACIHIPVGKGVCGTAVKERALQLVPDVHMFPGHIACDCASNSEIVLPLEKDGQILGVLDIDSPILNRFDECDAQYLEQVVARLVKGSDWAGIKYDFTST